MQQETRPRSQILRALAALAGAIVVLAVWAGLQLSGLGKAPFHTKGEPREALVVWEMAHGNGWVLPRRNGSELPSKPPFFHWLAAAASLTHGRVDEWTVRLPSAASSGAAAMLVYALGVLLWGPRAGLMAALALLTSFEWQRAATSARVDMTLTLGLTLSFTGLLLFRLRKRGADLVVLYAGMLWATLAKGPIGLALPLLAVGTVALVDPGMRPLRRLRPALGLLAVGSLAGVWYALAIWEGGKPFFAKQILFENVMRLAGGRQYGGGHEHSAAYLFGSLLAGLLPWSVFLPATLGTLTQARAGLRTAPALLLPLLWIVLVFAVYATAVSKRGVYLLGLYPAVFLLLGGWWDWILRSPDNSPPRWFANCLAAAAHPAATLLAVTAIAVAAERAGAPLFGTVAAFLTGEAAAGTRALGESAARHGMPLCGLLAGAAASAMLVAAFARSAHWGRVFCAFLLATSAVTVAVQHFILPAIAEQKTRRNFVSVLRRVAGDPREVFSYGGFDYGLTYYWGGRMPVQPSPLTPDGPRYLVVSDTRWGGLDSLQRKAYERVPQVQSGRSGNMGRLFLLSRKATPPIPSNPAPRLNIPASPTTEERTE